MSLLVDINFSAVITFLHVNTSAFRGRRAERARHDEFATSAGGWLRSVGQPSLPTLSSAAVIRVVTQRFSLITLSGNVALITLL